MGPSVGLSRSVVPPTPRKANDEPGRLMLGTVKRSCPCAPAYCNDATVFRAISRSSVTVQKVILGAFKRLSMARTRKLGSTAVPVVPPSTGPKLFTTNGIVPNSAPVGEGVVATCVGMAKLALSWKNGETAKKRRSKVMPKLARRVVLRLRPVQQPAPPPVKSQAKPTRGAMLLVSRLKNDLLVSTLVLAKAAPVKVPGAATAPL